MSWLDNFRVALRGTTSNKLRSALTMLGVLIGVAAVIILVAVGTGSSQAVENRIKALGTNTLTVAQTGRFGRGPATGGTQSQLAQLTVQDVQQIGDPNLAPDVQSVSPVINVQGATAAYGAASDAALSVVGSTPSYLTSVGDSVAAGAPLSSSEVANRSRYVLLGQTVVTDLFPTGTNPLGQTVVLSTSSGASSSFQVVGVLAAISSTTSLTDPNNVVIAPYTAIQDQLTGEASTFSELIVQGKSSNTLDAAEVEVETILAGTSGTTIAALPFIIRNEAQLLATAQSTTSTLTTFLAAVAAGALLIGGIGLMNIMLVTVTERTREIGIRKAIGATRAVIVGQFLTEAVLLSLVGGAVGVGVGLIGTHFTIDNVQPVVAPYSIPLAFGVSLVVGVFFGLYPANRAASLRPIDALRYE